MVKIFSIVILTLFIIIGNSYGQPPNPFTNKNDDLYIEGWYGVDGSGNLTGLLTMDIINRGSSALSRIDYFGVPDFQQCLVDADNWSCQYDPKSGMLSFIITSGTFEPQDRVSITVEYKNSKAKKLRSTGYIYYGNSERTAKMNGITRVEDPP